MLIDLSHPLEDGQFNFPNDPGIEVVSFHTVSSIGYNLSRLTMSSHHGTHLDAPYHFFDAGTRLDGIPLERFYGPTMLIDLAPGGCLASRTPLTLDMFQSHEALFQKHAKVIYRTGWDRMFGRPEFFTECPSLSLEAARFFAERRIGLLGMDTPTPSADWRECHHILLRTGVEIVIVEGLANLDLLPASFTLMAFPLNIRSRDGSPVRAVAVIED